MTARRVAAAALLAGCCAAVFATRVFVAFEPVRIRVVREPLALGTSPVRVRVTDGRADALRPPFPVIARIRNEAAEPQSFSVRLNGLPVCDAMVAARTAQRVDCVATEGWDRDAGREIVIDNASASWALEYLEVATHHGRSTGPIHALVVPAASTRHTLPHVAWVVLVWVVVTGLFLIPSPPLAIRALRIAQWFAAGVVAALFVAVVSAPMFSPYLVVLSIWTFVGWLSLPLLPRLWLLGQRVWRIAEAPVMDACRMLWRICFADGRRPAAAMSVAVLVVGLVYGSRAVGGSDEYGYASQAELWLDGSLRIDQSFAREAPWPRAQWTFAPFGYRPYPVDDRLIVPTYAPGLPLTLAAVKRIVGHDGMYFVTPICGALLVFATHGIGRRLGLGLAGLAGTWLVATSPVVLANSMVVMTDVPVAAAWVCAWYFLLGTRTAHAAGAGLLSSVAVLIRPNLAPLALVLGLHYILRMRCEVDRRRALLHGLIFGTIVACGAVVVGAINQYLYGSPFTSGYGSLGELFDATRIPENLRNYLGWLVEAHTPVVLVGLLAVLVPIRRLWPHAGERTAFIVIGAFIVTLWTIYAAWQVFDSWWFTRFLLSSWPFMMLGIAAVAGALWRVSAGWIKPVIVLIVLGLGVWQLRFARDHTVFEIGPGRAPLGRCRAVDQASDRAQQCSAQPHAWRFHSLLRRADDDEHQSDGAGLP